MKALTIWFPKELNTAQEQEIIQRLSAVIASAFPAEEDRLNVEMYSFSEQDINMYLLKNHIGVVKEISPLTKRVTDFIESVKVTIGYADKNPNEFAKAFVKLLIKNENLRNQEILGVLKNVRKYPEIQVVLEKEHFEKLPSILKDIWPAINWIL